MGSGGRGGVTMSGGEEKHATDSRGVGASLLMYATVEGGESSLTATRPQTGQGYFQR